MSETPTRLPRFYGNRLQRRARSRSGNSPSIIEDHKAGWKNAKHRQQWANTLETYAYPVIGDEPVADITTDHVLKVLKPIWYTKTETAARVRGRIETVLAAAKTLKLRDG